MIMSPAAAAATAAATPPPKHRPSVRSPRAASAAAARQPRPLSPRQKPPQPSAESVALEAVRRIYAEAAVAAEGEWWFDPERLHLAAGDCT